MTLPHPRATAALLRVASLSKALGADDRRVAIVADVSFQARAGEFISVVGPSGCGKTTLLMLLAGLYAPDAGTIEFNGHPLDGPAPGVSVVFQDYSRSLLPWKNVRDNVVFGMHRLSAWDNARRRARADELLEAVGLAGFGDHYPWQVSGGMQQRVAIARALAAESRLLLLDEPLAAVDAQTRADMQDLVLSLARRFEQTCVLVTHDVDEAVYMADRVLVLSNRPTRVLRDIACLQPSPRDQLETRQSPEFLRVRHEVLSMIRAMRTGETLPT